MDYNSIIHSCSAVVVAKQQQAGIDELDEAEIFNEILSYTKSIVELVKPTDLVYIAVDGVAPRAKIQQQRRRRYLSAHRNDVVNEFKKSNNIPISSVVWDSNCITPGTDFMTRLDHFLRLALHTQSFSYPVKEVVVSGHQDAGEGEHKIIQHIKQCIVQAGNDEIYDVIYGLDADLIMLSLSCSKSNMFLMRESNDFTTSKTVMSFANAGAAKAQMFKYLNIDMLRGCISKFLYGQEDTSYMYDYIFLCFLVGNDFIPNLSFLKIKHGALDLLCDVYKKVYDNLKEHLVLQDGKTFVVNHDFLMRVLEQIARVEDNGMKEAIGHYKSIYGTNNNHYRRYPSKLDRFMQELENSPLMGHYEPHIDSIDPTKDPKWRLNYYHELFGSVSTTIMRQCSTKYIEGLLWTTNYYFNLQVDTHWCYPYEYSPCASDLYKYICMMERDKFVSTQKQLQHTLSKNHIDTNVQMLMVLPPQSMRFVPKHLQSLYTNISLGCVHYFPSKFKLSSFLKTLLWECSPILPYVEFDRIRDSISRLNK